MTNTKRLKNEREHGHSNHWRCTNIHGWMGANHADKIIQRLTPQTHKDMAQVKISPRSFSINTDAEAIFDVTAFNIEALEAACKAYREETKLPETLADCRRILKKQKHDRDYFLTIGAPEEYKEDANWFPEHWQAEKLHALACLIQVWAAVHGEEGTANMHTASTWHLQAEDTSFIDFLPFKTKELRDQAMKIAEVPDLIKKAFSVK